MCQGRQWGVGGLAGLWHLVEQQARNISALGNKYAGMQGLPPAVDLAMSPCPQTFHGMELSASMPSLVSEP